MIDNTFKDSDEFKSFIEQAKKDKKSRHLHTRSQKQLMLYLSELFSHDCAVSEIAGVLGGRNDLMHFAFDGRSAVFEFFFSPSQVPQDLHLLEQSKAEIKIAILLDKEINYKLADEYFHKKPDTFPHLWLSDLLIESRKKYYLIILHNLLSLSNVKKSSNWNVSMLEQKMDDSSKVIKVNNISELDSALSSYSGKTVTGKYDFSGMSLDENLPKMFEEAQKNINATPVSFSVGITKIESTSISLPSNIKGNITVQY